MSGETLLVHRQIAEEFLPRIVSVLRSAGVTLHGDAQVVRLAPSVVSATDEDWATEYLSLDIAVRIVDPLADAVAHIACWGGRAHRAHRARLRLDHRQFRRRVDAAAVMINALTRSTDGSEFGFRAETPCERATWIARVDDYHVRRDRQRPGERPGRTDARLRGPDSAPGGYYE